MKKLLSLSMFVFLLALVVSAPSAQAKNDDRLLEVGVSGSSRIGGDDSSSSDDDSNGNSNSSSSSALEIEADIFTNETIVKVEMNDKKSVFSTSAKTREQIINEIIIKYPTLTKVQIEAILNLENENRASRADESSGERNDSSWGSRNDDNKKEDDRKNNNNDDNSFREKIKATFFGKIGSKDDSDEKNVTRKLSAESVFERFDGAVKHIEKFILRIETAMNKFQAEGKNTTEVKINLDNAKTDLAQAKDFHAKAKVEWELQGSTSKDLVKSYLQSAKEEIKSSFENLKKALVAMKDLRDNSDDDSSERN